MPRYGWRWGFLSLSLLALLCLPAALTMTRVDRWVGARHSMARPYCPSSLPEVEEERRPEGLLARCTTTLTLHLAFNHVSSPTLTLHRLVAAILDPALYARYSPTYCLKIH